MHRDTTRRTFVALTAASLAGCSEGQDGEASTPARTVTPAPTPTVESENPAVGGVAQMGDLELTSPAFEDGERIPEKYGRDEADVNPPLSISGVPDESETFVLIMDDPDAVEPAGQVWLHWLVWNIPASMTEIPEGWEPTEVVVGTNDFGERAYGGPAPPDREHAYRFKLYALETTLDPPAMASKREVGEAMQSGRVAQTQLEGTYAP